MKKVVFYCLCTLSFILHTTISSHAAEWRFPVGLTYASGFSDVKDLYIDNLETEGYSVSDDFSSPVGISFQPYLQFENGLGFGLGIGPILMVWSNEASFLGLPIGADLRYTPFHSSSVSPYIRAGARYNISTGDYQKSTTPGLFGAVGLEFLRDRMVSVGFELSYDTSEVEFEKYVEGWNRFGYYSYVTMEKIKPLGFMISFFVVF